jgi:hypothetical protein
LTVCASVRMVTVGEIISPHSGQNLARGGLSFPQFGQTFANPLTSPHPTNRTYGDLIPPMTAQKIHATV